MKFAFINFGYESLGLEYLSACLKQEGHEAELIIEPDFISPAAQIKLPIMGTLKGLKKRIIKDVIKSKSDVIAFQVVTHNYQFLLSVAAEIKKINPDILILFGGIHTSAVPNIVISNDQVDYVIVGEAEVPIVKLANALGGKGEISKVPNLWRKEKKIIPPSCNWFISNIDSLPLPDKSIFYNKIPSYKYEYITLTSRKCPFNCIFCSNKVLLRQPGKIRVRNVKKIIEEIKLLGKDSKYVHFVDPVFGLATDKKKVSDFCKIYPKIIGKPYSCHLCPTLITEDLIKMLKMSGCYHFEMGVQVSNEKLRKKIVRRFITNNQITKAVNIINRYKFFFSIAIIKGWPSENDSDIKSESMFYKELRASRINIHWLELYPGTDFINTALREGNLNKKDVFYINNGLGWNGSKTNIPFSFPQNNIFKKYKILFNLFHFISDKMMKKLFKYFGAKWIPSINLLFQLLFIINAMKSKDLKVYIFFRLTISKMLYKFKILFPEKLNIKK